MPTRLDKAPRADSILAEESRDESGNSKEGLLEAVSGISMYAHHARRFTMTDRTIDRFVAETLVSIVGDIRMDATETVQILRRAEEIFTRAKNLYLWSCEAFCRPPKPMRETLLKSGRTDENGLKENQVGHTGARQAGAGRGHDLHYWQQVCLTKLSNLAGIALKWRDVEPPAEDVFGFIHKCLTRMAEGLSVFELVALVQLVEKKSLQVVHEQLSGDTIVATPPARTGVKQSEILVISEPPPPPKGSYETGVAG